jgi:hypothetical protein
MEKKERIEALVWLGENLFALPGVEEAIQQAGIRNAYFTDAFVRLALTGIQSWFSPERLESWSSDVKEPEVSKKVGLVMAGNIPLVGFHDLMSVFVSGHIALYKPSGSDEVLPDFLLQTLVQRFPKLASRFQKTERLNTVEALIATGSRNTAVHFNHYFRHIPRIVRGARSSIGVVYGFEQKEELEPLCDDIMQYFGMGCRSITKLLVPDNYDFHPFFEALEKYRYLTDHHRFQNNAIYHKSIFLMNGDTFLDNDILMVRERPELFSPQGVLHFEVYPNLEQAREIVRNHSHELQCHVSYQGQFPESIPFGTAQHPAIDDYADGIDTLQFLGKL